MDNRTKEQYIVDRMRYLGIAGYICTEQESLKLRELAKEMRLSPQVIEELGHCYNNIHAVNIPELIGIGKMNAFIGIFHDASLKRYYKIAKIIEQTQREYREC